MTVDMMRWLTFVLAFVAPFSAVSSALLLKMFSSFTKEIKDCVSDIDTNYIHSQGREHN